MPWHRKHLLTIEELKRAEIEQVLATAGAFRRILDRKVKKVPALRGKTIVNLFLEPSTRTRISFEMAAKLLSADVISFDSASSSTSKGETLRDTAQNIQALNADMIVLRHSASGSPLYLSNVLGIPVINAGDGAHEHPTQALLDVFTMREKLGDLKGRKVVILGDILFSRVARSNIHALTKLGADVTIVGPSTLVPHWFEAMGVKVSHNLRTALADADVVMLLRIQHERQGVSHFPSIGEYTSMFGLNYTRASWVKPDAIIMHPGPINRGVEIDSDIADSPRSVILQQVTNGIAVRMAVLYLCAGGQPEHVLRSRRVTLNQWATKCTKGAKMNEPIARQLADTIRQTAFEAHTFLRHGHNEKVYENSLRNRLRKKGLVVDQQMPIAVHDEDGSPLGEFLADLVVNQEFIVELKAVRTLVDEHTAQILGYLRASRIEHGMLINFGSPRIQFQKYILRESD